MCRFGEGGKGVGDEITQQTLLPEVRDPNLWIVKCRIGEEKVSRFQQLSRYPDPFEFEFCC